MAGRQQHQADVARPQGKENVGQSLRNPAPATRQSLQHLESAKRDLRRVNQPQQLGVATAGQASKRMGSNSQSRPGSLVQPQQQRMDASAGAQTRQPPIQQQSKAAARPAGFFSTAPALQCDGQLYMYAAAPPAGGDNTAAESFENTRHASGHRSQLRAYMQAPGRAAQTDAGHKREQQAMQQPGLGLEHAADQPSDHPADRKERLGVRHVRRLSNVTRESPGPQQPSWTAAAQSNPAQPDDAKRQAATATAHNPGGRLQDAAACRIVLADQHKGSCVPSQRPAAGMPGGYPGEHKGQRLPGSQRGRGSRAPSVAGSRSHAAMSLPGNTKRSKVGDLSKQSCTVRCCVMNILHLPAGGVGQQKFA